MWSRATSGTGRTTTSWRGARTWQRRIAELRQQREDAARAARVPIEQVLAELDRCGVDHVADFFDRDAAGILRVRDLRGVPVEVSLALVRLLRESLAVMQ